MSERHSTWAEFRDALAEIDAKTDDEIEKSMRDFFGESYVPST